MIYGWRQTASYYLKINQNCISLSQVPEETALLHRSMWKVIQGGNVKSGVLGEEKQQ
jgi:hypothetical protein